MEIEEQVFIYLVLQEKRPTREETHRDKDPRGHGLIKNLLHGEPTKATRSHDRASSFTTTRVVEWPIEQSQIVVLAPLRGSNRKPTHCKHRKYKDDKKGGT